MLTLSDRTLGLHLNYNTECLLTVHRHPTAAAAAAALHSSPLPRRLLIHLHSLIVPSYEPHTTQWPHARGN